MREKVLRYIRERRLMRAGDRVAVAVSGGADSVALLRVLLELRAELGVVVSVAHFNHGLRGEASEADEAFVAELARQHDLEFFCGRADVRDHALTSKLSVEAAARELRYRWFGWLAAQKKLDVIATGHTLDDQAETVLLKFLRGAGTRGLAGIYPEIGIGAKQIAQGRKASVPSAEADAFLRTNGLDAGLKARTTRTSLLPAPSKALDSFQSAGPGAGSPPNRSQSPRLSGARIVRPLLEVTREEVEQYLTALGQTWREDESNLDHRFARNRVRHELLPLLAREYNPNIRHGLSNAAELSRGEEEYWQALVERELQDRIVPPGETEAHPEGSTVPEGTQQFLTLHPGLTPWAKITSAPAGLDVEQSFHRGTLERVLTHARKRSTGAAGDGTAKAVPFQNGVTGQCLSAERELEARQPSETEIPQGLKPDSSVAGDGTAEAVPLQSSGPKPSRIVPESAAPLPNCPSVRLSLDSFAALPLALQRRLLRRFLESQQIAADFEHIEKLLRCALGELPKAELPGGWLAVRQGGCLELRAPQGGPPFSGYQYTLPVPGEVRIAELGLTLRSVLVPEEFAREAGPPDNLLSAELLGPELTVRNWRPGDRFWPLHSKAEEKLKRLFSQRHIPAEQRCSWPVVLYDAQIVWVKGLPVARAFAWSGSDNAVKIELLG